MNELSEISTAGNAFGVAGGVTGGGGGGGLSEDFLQAFRHIAQIKNTGILP